jgi:hypothetical protein
MSPERRRELEWQQRARHVALDALREAFQTGTAAYWERRAVELEAARPKRGDFNGAATPADLTERWDRLTAAAAACRARAQLVEQTDRELVDALADLGEPYDTLEQQLRAALDTGNPAEIRRLGQLVDQADDNQVA